MTGPRLSLGLLGMVKSWWHSLLLDSGVDVEQATTDNGETALLAAAQNDYLEIVKLLVASGARKDRRTTDTGMTPLFVSANEGHFEVVQYLIEAGVKIDGSATHNGETPLDAAARNGHKSVFRFLKRRKENFQFVANKKARQDG